MSNGAGRDEAAEYVLAIQDLMASVEEKIEELLRSSYVDLSRATSLVPRGNLPSTGNTGTGYTPGDGSVTTAKIGDGSVTIPKLAFDPATQAELDDHAATRGDGDFGHVKPDGLTILSAGGVLSVSESATGSTTLLGLSDVPDSYSGHAGKQLRVKTDEIGVDFVAETPRTSTILMVTPGSGASRTWGSMPTPETEIFGASQHRLELELAPWTQTRLQARIGVPGGAGSAIRAKFSTDGGATWQYLDGSTGPSVDISATTNLTSSSWATLSSAARTGNVLLALFGINGGGASATFGQIWIQFK